MRRHTLTRFLFILIAIAVALAVGIALGAGPLGDRVKEKRDELTNAAPSKRVTSDPLDRAFAAAVAPQVLAGKLASQSVALIALPGTAEAEVARVAEAIGAANGTVASTTYLTTVLTRASEKPMVEALGAQVVDQLPNVLAGELTTYPRMGALLGAALTTTQPASQPADEVVQTLRDTFQTAAFVQSPITGDKASLALVISADEVDPAIMAGLIEGLRPRAVGVAVVGQTHDPNVDALRDSERIDELGVGTFDGLETAAGSIGSVALTALQITSPGGNYGASGSDGTLPLR